MPPTYSLIVPTLNEAKLLPQNLAWLNALQGDKEIIVADGGSTDGTPELAAPLARVVKSERGRGRQMNVAARAAAGRILVFVHADCVLEAGALEEIAGLLASDDVAAGCFRQRITSQRLAYRLIERCANWRTRWLQ